MIYHTNDKWATFTRYDKHRYTISLTPAMLKTAYLWSGKEYIRPEIEDNTVRFYLEDTNISKMAKLIRARNGVTGEDSDREKPLDFLYTFPNEKTASFYEPLLQDKFFFTKDFCARRSNKRGMPYIALRFNDDYTQWEVGRCVQK